MDALALWTLSAITLVVILAGIEGGCRLGRATRVRSEDEKELRPQGGYLPVSQQSLEDVRTAIDAAVSGQKVAH